MNLLGDFEARADLWVQALCAERRPAPGASLSAWRSRLDRPFDPRPSAVAAMKQLCQRCPLTTTCRAEGVGAEYGVWAGELHEPKLADELGAEAS